jgi:hypothetical protein
MTTLSYEKLLLLFEELLAIKLLLQELAVRNTKGQTSPCVLSTFHICVQLVLCACNN